MAGGVNWEEEDPEARLVRNPYLVRVRDLLLEAVDALQLPPNPLDHLVDLCGGPTKVTPTHVKPSFLELFDILCRGATSFTTC